MTDDDAYGGVIGAIPYAYRTTGSYLCKSYVVVGTLFAAALGLLFTLALVVLVANTGGGPGGTFTFSRAFFIVVGLLVVVPTIAPILLVARRHRRTGSDDRYDAALAVAGYLFVASLYLGLVISVPEGMQTGGGGVVGVLFDLPQVAAVVPPLVAAGVIALVHRRLGGDRSAGADGVEHETT
jgi:hypothetical protein